MKTRMEIAREGIISEEVKQAASVEKMSAENMQKKIAEGTVVLARNKLHQINPTAIGNGTRIKINANIGTSPTQHDIELEIKKLKIAIEAGADAVMDLSTGGPIKEIRQRIMDESSVAIGTVPIYQAVAENEKHGNMPHQMKTKDFFRIVEEHCKQGVDFLTIHCGINKQSSDAFIKSKRIAGVVSRGGALVLEWMKKNGKENPYYEKFDDLLAILHEYDVTLSLGDGMRPGCLHDATDSPQIEELRILGELVERSREAGVQTIVEGPGHVPLHQVETNIRLQKAICNNAPFYVLGPLVTDSTPGYDHISGAIGGAIAAMAGADFLCYLTPAEHLRLPSLQDVKEGIIASKIAAHAADIANGIPDAMEWDNAISKARTALDWEQVLSLCIDPDKAKEYRESLPAAEDDLCSMCGKFCAVKRSREIKQ